MPRTRNDAEAPEQEQEAPAPVEKQEPEQIQSEPYAPPAPGLGSGEDENTIEVETTGDFMLQDPFTLDEIPADGSAKVRNTIFIQNCLEDGRLKKA